MSLLPPHRQPVVDSRVADDGTAIRRRRSCPECGRRFTTLETAAIAVVKRSGVDRAVLAEPRSSRASARPARAARSTKTRSRSWPSGSKTTCAPAAAARSRARTSGWPCSAPLRELDDVAYVRFSSVYRGFDSLEAFEAEIALLRAERDLQNEAEPRP